MSRLRSLVLVPMLGLVLALAAACGGGGEGEGQRQNAENVPENAVAVIAGTPILRTEFDRFFRQAEQATEARGEDFPQAGTPEYVDLQNQAVEFLVQRVELAKEAEALGITVADADIDERLEQIKNQFFEGDEQKYKQEIEALGLTDADVRADARAQLVSEKIFADVTKGIAVSADEVRKYFDDRRDQFTVPEQRQVAHILVKEKKLADDIYAQLQDGADFGELALEHSTDKASAEEGGKLLDQKGSFVPEFEQVAFSLDTGELGKPVQSQFGWHVIKALEDTEPEQKKTFEEVKEQIEDQLLREKQNTAMTEWVDGIRAKYEPQVSYAVGFGPTAASQATTSTTP